jgi:hypothetical protein
LKKGILEIILKLSVIFILAGSLIVYCEIRLREIPNSYTVKKVLFEKQLDSIQVLILGNSQPLYGIDPKYFDLKGFNLANSSQSLYYDKEITLKYLDRMPKLKIVIISVSYFSMWSDLYTAYEDWRDAFYLFWDVKTNNPHKFDIRRLSYIALYGPAYTQNLFKRNFSNVGVDNPADNGRGICPPGYSFPLTDISGKERVKIHDDMMHDDLLKNNTEYLEEFISALQKRNIVPVLITTPVYKTYYDNMNPKKEEVNEEVLNNLSKKYSIKYLNYLKDSRFDSTDYANNDHLNDMGIEKYSKILNEEVIKPYAKGKH